jgi:hypothetical protein
LLEPLLRVFSPAFQCGAAVTPTSDAPAMPARGFSEP